MHTGDLSRRQKSLPSRVSKDGINSTIITRTGPCAGDWGPREEINVSLPSRRLRGKQTHNHRSGAKVGE